MTKTLYRRKNYFIKKGLQLKVTLSIVVTLLAVMLVTGAAVYIGMWGSIIANFSSFKVSQNLENIKRMTDYERSRYGKGDFRLEKIFRQAELLSAQEKQAVRNALRSVNRTLAPKLILLVVFIFAGGIFFSHKIAGPLYRFEKSAQAIKEGNLRTSFRIRKHDELQQTSAMLDEMARSLRRDIEQIQAGFARLKGELNIIKSGLDPDKASRLGKTILEIEESLSRYTT
jgi:methyl-accepting chemotaxis protein